MGPHSTSNSTGLGFDRPPSYTPFHSTDATTREAPNSASQGPPHNIKATSYVSITSSTSSLTGTFVIDPHKAIVPVLFSSRFRALSSESTQPTQNSTGPSSKDRLNLQLVGTNGPIDVTVWLVESSSRPRTSQTRTRIVMTQTKDQPITAHINRPSPTPSMSPLLSRPTAFTAHVSSHGPVHLSIPRNFCGPLIVVTEARAVFSADIQSAVTAWEETIETLEPEGEKVRTSCFVGDWEELDEEEQRGGEHMGGAEWKYDELDVSGSSVVVYFVDEGTPRDHGFVDETSGNIGCSPSTDTSNFPTCVLRPSSLVAGPGYRIRNVARPDLYLEMQDDDFVQAVPLNELNDGQKWNVILHPNDDDYKISNIKGNRTLSIVRELGKTVPLGKRSDDHSRWLLERHLKTCIIGIPNDECVLDLPGGKSLIFCPSNGRKQQCWFLEPYLLNASSSVAEGEYIIHNRGQNSMWNAGHSPIKHIHCHVTTLESGRNYSCLRWNITHDSNSNILFESPYAPSSWPGADLKGSSIPVPWCCIPESTGSKWYYLTTDMFSYTPQVATSRSSNDPGFFADLKQGNHDQMWEFIHL